MRLNLDSLASALSAAARVGLHGALAYGAAREAAARSDDADRRRLMDHLEGEAAALERDLRPGAGPAQTRWFRSGAYCGRAAVSRSGAGFSRAYEILRR